MSQKPFKTLRYHKKAIRSVQFHEKYPLFCSGSDDGTIIVSHGRVYNDLATEPLIVPVKVLKGIKTTKNYGVLDVKFHPNHPWVFGAGVDGSIRKAKFNILRILQLEIITQEFLWFLKREKLITRQ